MNRMISPWEIRMTEEPGAFCNISCLRKLKQRGLSRNPNRLSRNQNRLSWNQNRFSLNKNWLGGLCNIFLFLFPLLVMKSSEKQAFLGEKRSMENKSEKIPTFIAEMGVWGESFFV